MNLKPILIETQRLQLIGYTFQDMKSIFENFSKPEIMKILGHRGDDDFQKEEFKYKNGYAAYNRTFILFLLKDKTTESIIGRCGLHNWNEEPLSCFNCLQDSSINVKIISLLKN